MLLTVSRKGSIDGKLQKEECWILPPQQPRRGWRGGRKEREAFGQSVLQTIPEKLITTAGARFSAQLALCSEDIKQCFRP